MRTTRTTTTTERPVSKLGGGRQYRERRELLHRWCRARRLDPSTLSATERCKFQADLEATTGMVPLGPLEAAGVFTFLHQREAEAIFNGGRFTSLYQSAAEQALVGNASIPSWVRVFHAALSRAHEDGHAPFATGELAEMLDVRADKIRPAVERAVEEGLLSPTSTDRCLALPAALHRSGSGKRGQARCGHERRAEAYPTGSEMPGHTG